MGPVNGGTIVPYNGGVVRPVSGGTIRPVSGGTIRPRASGETVSLRVRMAPRTPAAAPQGPAL